MQPTQKLVSAALFAVLATLPINPAPASTSSGTAVFEHIVLILEENTDYNSIIGNPSAPYFNSLASTYGLATNYYANTHPSIGNYFWLTTGQDLTDDDSQTPSSFPVSVDNVVRRLVGSGVSWKAYAECMPRVGYIGGDTTCPNGDNYYVRHVPLEYMTDVQNNATQRNNLVPFESPTVGFAHDVANNTLPGYSFVTPDGCHDAHDCDISVADNWLQQNIGPLINNTSVMQNTLVIIVFDESGSDDTNGGGRIYWVAIGPQVNLGYISTTFYQHQSTLRESLEGLGLAFDLAGAATAPSMDEFFTSGVMAPTAILSANPSSICSGQSSTLTWASTNATSCTGTNFSTGSAVSGSVAVTPSTTTTYSVSCTGAVGSASASATVTVSNSMPTFAIGARDATTTTVTVLSRPNTYVGSVLCMETAGSLGTITGGPRTNQGFIWWHVAYDDGCTGWTIQDSLSLYSSLSSPDGSTLTPGCGGTLTTSAGTWSFSTATDSSGNIILLNGQQAGGDGSGILLLVYNGGQMYAENNTQSWYQWTSSGWNQIAGDPRG
jgi:acid phosphatase